jgi:hypothetical protein
MLRYAASSAKAIQGKSDAAGRAPASSRAVRPQWRQKFVSIEVDMARQLENEDGDPRDQISRLETQVEELAEAMARCRKIKLISQIAIAGGGLWMVAATIGIIGFDPVAMLAAISGVIGGTVMYGSNTTTSQEIEAAMKDAEALRAELIGQLELRVVGEGE